MELPKLLANWQLGYFYLGVIFISLFFVASLQIAVRSSPKYENIITYALMLMTLGALSTLLDLDIVDKSLKIQGVFLSQAISLSICLMMLALLVGMIAWFMFWARAFCWREHDFTSITFFFVLLSAISTISIIAAIVNFPRIHNEVKLLREFIFIVIPTCAVLSIIFGILLQKVIKE